MLDSLDSTTLFYRIFGETPSTFRRGTEVKATVTRVVEEYRILVRLDNGLQGSIEAEDFRERLKCANAEIARLREEASVREDSGASVEKMCEKYEKKIAVLEDRLRGYRDYAKRMARMAAMEPEAGTVREFILKEESAL